MQEISNKNFFKNYAFFILILLVIFAVLSYTVVVSKKAWSKNLAVSVQKVFDEEEPGRWKVGNSITVNNPVTVNCAAYEVVDVKTNTKMKAIIIRTITFYGPVSAVFSYKEGETADFIGYSSLHGRIKTQLLNNKSDKRREYWQNKIPDILK